MSRRSVEPEVLFSVWLTTRGWTNPPQLQKEIDLRVSNLLELMERNMTTTVMEDRTFWDPETTRYQRRQVFRLTKK
jgi:hypothetical protein